jgi:hypothetical protein
MHFGQLLRSLTEHVERSGSLDLNIAPSSNDRQSRTAADAS